MPEQRFDLTYDKRPWTVNDERGGHHNNLSHWSKLSPLKMEWRQAFKLLAKQAKVPHYDRIGIEVRQWCRTEQMPDTGANYGAVKSAIDGLVDAQVIDDDDRRYVRYIFSFAPEKGPKDALVLTIVGDASDLSPRPTTPKVVKGQRRNPVKKTVASTTRRNAVSWG
jgi:hypothetical protein